MENWYFHWIYYINWYVISRLFGQTAAPRIGRTHA